MAHPQPHPQPHPPPGHHPHPPLSHRWALVSMLVLLNGLDFIVTVLLLDRGATEANPLMAPVIGTIWGWWLKTVGVGLLALLILSTGRDGEVERRLRYVVALYVGVVTWNLVTLVVRT